MVILYRLLRWQTLDTGISKYYVSGTEAVLVNNKCPVEVAMILRGIENLHLINANEILNNNNIIQI